jgi:hypothetical protein
MASEGLILPISAKAVHAPVSRMIILMKIIINFNINGSFLPFLPIYVFTKNAGKIQYYISLLSGKIKKKRKNLYFSVFNGINKSLQIHIPKGNTSYDQVYHSNGQFVKALTQI